MDTKLDEKDIDKKAKKPPRSAPKSPASVKPFLFDLYDFETDVLIDEPDEPDEPPPPVFSLEELEEAKQKANAQGWEKGMADALETIEKEIATTLENTTSKIENLLAAEHAREMHFQEDILKLFSMALQTTFPKLHSYFDFNEMTACVEETLDRHSNKSKIVITVSTNVVEQMVEHFSKRLPEEMFQKINFKGDDALSDGDCRVEWTDGGMIRNTKTLRENIEASIIAHIDEETQKAIASEASADAMRLEDGDDDTAQTGVEQVTEHEDETTAQGNEDLQNTNPSGDNDEVVDKGEPS